MKHYQATIIKYWLMERKSNFLNNVQAMILLNHAFIILEVQIFCAYASKFSYAGLAGKKFHGFAFHNSE